jgi:aryl-alcohol dehydrogenase-like predicted oxidoreductase
MAQFPQRVKLGRTGLSVGPLAVSGGYGVDEKSLLKAFDRGVNYWYHGSRTLKGMTGAIKTLIAAGKRDDLVIALQSYVRWPWYMERTLTKELRMLGIDHCDVLLLGWYNKLPSASVVECTDRLREKGLFRHLAISSHNRPTFVELAKDPRYGAFHIRYNAAHTGAERDVFPNWPSDNRPGTVAYTATRWGSLLKAKAVPAGEAPMCARDAYRFVLSNPDFNVCMTGPKNAAEMDEALATLDDGPLSVEENARIRGIGIHVYDGAFNKG